MPEPKIKSVRIFTTSWCAFCKAEKKFLDAHNVSYESVDVEENEAAAAEMIKTSGQMGVPFTIIEKADDTKVGILGFDQPRLKTELGLA